MSDYYWDTQFEYLRNTRKLYYNDDYLEFLIKIVWKITTPVNIIDYGCGYGFLGLKLLPMLPEGSTFTLRAIRHSVWQKLEEDSEMTLAVAGKQIQPDTPAPTN
ncbi:hypothetical protein AB4Z21_22820, partial [Paenibacillus sp. MCAF20]